jgi:hypothetical protein
MNLRKAAPLLALLFCAAIPLFAETHAEAVFKKYNPCPANGRERTNTPWRRKRPSRFWPQNRRDRNALSRGMEEMVTLYSIDGDGIALVHYCPTNNQPRMRVVPPSNNIRELSFDYQALRISVPRRQTNPFF